MSEWSFNGICRIELDDNHWIKVFKESEEESSQLDFITTKISEIAENHSYGKVENDENCLLCYPPTDNLQEEEASLIKEEIDNIELPKDLLFRDQNQSNSKRPTQPCPASSPNPPFGNISCECVQTLPVRDLLNLKGLHMPAYQRPYMWGRRNINFLWDDIQKDAQSNEEGTYDFGIIVLHKDGDRYDIVDGQQRIVTISLMLRSLGSNAADRFIEGTELNGKESEKNIGYSFQWFRIHAERLGDKQKLAERILDSTVDIVTMDNLESALKFFDRMNATGVPLSEMDILKSHHLLAIANAAWPLSEEAEKRWKKLFGAQMDDGTLSDKDKFKRKIVQKWEAYNQGFLKTCLSRACSIRLMAQGQHWYGSMDEIWDIDQFREGINQNGEYTGLDCHISDGEFFFWYAFNLYEQCDAEANKLKEYDSHAYRLSKLLADKHRAKELFDTLVVYLHEKRFKKTQHENAEMLRDKVLDLIFSWIIYRYLYQDSLQFTTLKNDAMGEDSVFRAIVNAKYIGDCLDCHVGNPLEMLQQDGWGKRAEGNGIRYLIRREIRRIYG